MSAQADLGTIPRFHITVGGDGYANAYRNPEGAYVLYYQHAAALTAQQERIAELERALAWVMRTQVKNLALIDPRYTNAINAALAAPTGDKG